MQRGRCCILTYNNLVQKALLRLPTFKIKYDEMIKEDVLDVDSGMHIVFGYVFTPILKEAIINCDKKTTRDFFSFLEQMASSDDNLFVEVCDQSVLEELNDDFDGEDLYKYMGPKTKIGFEAIKQYMNQPERNCLYKSQIRGV